MSRKKRPTQVSLALFTGMYTRVARQTGVHPSYVSRVARGERRSERVSRAIASELAQFAPSRGLPKKASAETSAPSEEFRQRVIRRLAAHPELTKLGAVVVDLEGWGTPKERLQVSRVSLQARIAANAPMIAASMEQFHRMSRKLERSPHVLSLADNEGVVLYALGAIVRLHEEGRIPGTNWGRDYAGPSAAAKAITAGVPVIIVGKVQPNDKLLPVRMACPIRLGNGEVAGAVVLSIDLSPARAEHLIEIAKMARKICKIVEGERKKPSRARPRKEMPTNAEHHGINDYVKHPRANSAKAPSA